MEELTDAQAISILGQMDAEQRAWDQQWRARKRIKEVIQHFDEVKKALPAWEEKLRETASKIDNLNGEYKKSMMGAR